MAKKGIALALSMAMVINMSPIELLQSYAEEMEQKSNITYVSQVEDTENEEHEGMLYYYDERTTSVTADITKEGDQYGHIEGLGDSQTQVKLESHFAKDTKYSLWKYIDGDDSTKITLNPKRGCEFKYSFADLSSATSLGAYIKVQGDRLPEVSHNEDTDITINPAKSTAAATANVQAKGTINVKFSKSRTADEITAISEGNGTVTLSDKENLDDLYYEENEDGTTTYTVEDGGTLDYIVTPGTNQQIESIEGGTIISEDGVSPVVVRVDNEADNNSSKKQLKVVFSEIPAATFDLGINITGKGSVKIKGQELESGDSIKLDENKEYKVTINPDEDYYISLVKLGDRKLSPNEDGSYSVTINEALTLSVDFAEKMEPEIVFEEGALRVPWDNTEKTLSYKIVDKDGETLDEGNVEFKETYTILGQTYERVIKPKDVGTYSFKVKYDGNEQYKSKEFEDVFEIYDNRKEAKIVIDESELTKVYNGQVQKPVAKLVDAETGEVVEDVDVDVTYDFRAEDPLNTFSTPGKDAGEYKFTATFKGDYNYSKVSTKGTMTIQKCKPSVKVSNDVVEYTGEKITTTVTTNPKVGYINVYTGVDLKLHGKIYVDLNLGDDSASKIIKDLIEKADIGNVGDLKEVINTISTTPVIKDLIDVADIQKALEYIPDDLSVKFGAPIDAGAYISTAIVLDKNAEVAVGVGSLIIYRQNGQVVFTEDSLPNKSVVKYGDDYKFEAVYKDSQNSAKIMYAGITGKGEAYFSAEKPTEVGAYAAVAYSYDDPQYKTALAGRVFAISKETTTVEITSDLEKLYDGNPYEATSEVKDSKGNIIEDANVKYTYYKGCKKLDSAPTEVGKYTVVATYKCSDSYYASVDIKNITIKNAIEVVFDADNGSDLDKHRLGKGDVLNYTPEVPTKEGYTFVGWYKETDDLTTKYASGRSYCENVTYKAKWAHMYSDKTLAQVTSSTYKSMTFTGRVYCDGDEIVEKGILAIPTSLLKQGENLTLNTSNAAKFVMKTDINPDKGYGYYGGKVNSISIKNSDRKMTGCTYVKYKTAKGQEYVVYSYNPEGPVSANDILNK